MFNNNSRSLEVLRKCQILLNIFWVLIHSVMGELFNHEFRAGIKVQMTPPKLKVLEMDRKASSGRQ